MYYHIAGKIERTKYWRMSKKVCFGEYNFGDLYAIDHTHCLPTVHDQPTINRRDKLSFTWT